MTIFVSCGNGGVEGKQGYDCTGLYRPEDPSITGDMPRVQLEQLGVKGSFYDATVASAESMDVPVCRICPARIIKAALKK